MTVPPQLAKKGEGSSDARQSDERHCTVSLDMQAPLVNLRDKRGGGGSRSAKTALHSTFVAHELRGEREDDTTSVHTKAGSA
jgi:hypothetical protein